MQLINDVTFCFAEDNTTIQAICKCTQATIEISNICQAGCSSDFFRICNDVFDKQTHLLEAPVVKVLDQHYAFTRKDASLFAKNKTVTFHFRPIDISNYIPSCNCAYIKRIYLYTHAFIYVHDLSNLDSPQKIYGFTLSELDMARDFFNKCTIAYVSLNGHNGVDPDIFRDDVAFEKLLQSIKK